MSRSLDESVAALPGVGPVRAAAFADLGVHTLGDLLHLKPRRYEDRSRLRRVADLEVGETALVTGVIDAVRLKRARFRRRSYLVATVRDGDATIQAVWFNQPYIRSQFRKGDRILLHGKVKSYRGLQMVAPEYEVQSTDDGEPEVEPRARGLVPIHPATADLRPRLIRRLVSLAIERTTAELEADPLPESLRRRRELRPLADAVRALHFPVDESDATRARDRLAYDEFLTMQLALVSRRRGLRGERKVHELAHDANLERRIRRRFPFSFTEDQERAIAEIRADLLSPAPMNRLLHGEVGSGKTAVAAYAMLLAIANRSQVAFLAPTEVLAEQHMRTLGGWLAGSRVKLVHLPGGLPARERASRLAAISSGKADLIVGTHALLEEPVTFPRLALAVIDEQHKFGVAQRQRLREKGTHPDVLVMTATPIPRTLALTLFSDLDVSTLRGLPPGRVPVRTRIVENRRERQVHEAVREQVARGRQAYFVYPLIEESEALDLRCAETGHERLRDDVFPDLRVGLVHGRLPASEKDAAMDAFRRGETQILVATSVIEVGVDVPNATSMVVEEAGRFGLAQLHQLRGRIGRGADEATCFLLPGKAGALGRRRLRILRDTNDGFRIAEADLELRGPGEVFGWRQHGLPEFRIADPFTQLGLLEAAREDAATILTRDPKLVSPEHERLREKMTREPGARADLAKVG
ncbi:MAG: ATP-dependent DNA helicase RecG [Planctomycetes bacterium]|nr:ATP-dependent DNA helicase RecG [Planctomycetota bacterium]MBI3847291.1 ATP-dependent DNA helicase RecG [Planctomycetota bacterium]